VNSFEGGVNSRQINNPSRIFPTPASRKKFTFQEKTAISYAIMRIPDTIINTCVSIPPKGIRRTLCKAVSLLLIFQSGIAAPGILTGGQLGPYRYYLYRPAHSISDAPLPLVIVLHGCDQNAADISQGTQFNALADKERFAVLYPQTRPDLNNPYGCWVWWDPDNQRRNSGEPKLVVDMVDLIKRQITIDTDRVYVAGLSSGGALSAILASVYPDVFAAAGFHSALEYGAATTAACALSAMQSGGPMPEGRGEIAYHSSGTRHRVVPVIVFQGTSDRSVRPVNADQLVSQFAQLDDYADDGDGENDSMDGNADAVKTESVPGGYRYTIEYYFSKDGDPIMQRVLVENLGHAWSGGNPAGSYTDPNGPDASRMMWAFFRRWSLQNPSIETRLSASCKEKRAANCAHYWWHHTMSFKEYLCDPWRISWRHTFGETWAGGRCP
jgi:poly(hydroxyalkanoate) depolymerase family esterase